MIEYVTVKIDIDDVLDLFINRLKWWDVDNQTIELFVQMYKHYLENGVFKEIELNIMNIVDNDYINYCSIIDKDTYNNDFNKLLKLYKEGEYDVSCETFEEIAPSFIEAVSDDETAILIRY